jgi:beta-glucosidase
VDQKLISRAQLEATVARVYKGRFQVGEFNPHSTLYKPLLPDDAIYSTAHQQVSLESAQQSLVLLRNDNRSGIAKLPLRPGLKIAGENEKTLLSQLLCYLGTSMSNVDLPRQARDHLQ